MYIYKITNKITGQAYVGQSHEPFNRWKVHCYSNGSPIQKATHELGIINFTFEILEVCSEQEANDRETFWIQFYHCYGNGYNTNRGEGIKNEEITIMNPPKQVKINRGKNKTSAVEEIDPETGEVLHYFKSIAEAQKFCNCGTSGHISAVCRGRGRTAYGYEWRYA